jgi:hypothetical protein
MEVRMRFEVAAAYCFGIALPILEVCRRGRDFSQVAAYADDFLAGGLLLWAATSMSRRKAIGPILLVVAWAALCGGFYYSFFGQLESTARSDVSGLSNWLVVVIKGALYAVAIVALVLSVRHLARQRVAPGHPPQQPGGTRQMDNSGTGRD